MPNGANNMANKSNQKWFANAVVYQIYPRSFYDANDDGIGDLEGIIAKLDHLKGAENSLDIDVIWLSPVYKSPMADFGYDISDHIQIDPLFGNMHIFEELVKEAHRREIKIIMDFVPNHTSSQHPWFLESRSSTDNPKRDWYIWSKADPQQGSPNNWLSIFGGSGWEYDPETQSYYFHSFLKEQPDLNWHNPEVKKAMHGILEFWLENGVDGFRIDAVDHIFKDPQLRDNPPNPGFIPGKMNPYFSQLKIHSQNLDETMKAIKEFGRILDKYPEKIMVSEADLTLDEIVKFYTVSPHLHAPFNFCLLSLPCNAAVYKNFIDEFERRLSKENIPTYVLGNHDQPRVVSRVGVERARLLAMLILTMRGIRFIYYGEEIGMADVHIPANRIQDPLEKTLPGLKLGRDPQRTPMQWSHEMYAGFTRAGRPWLPVAEYYPRCNVQTESEDPYSMLWLYKTLIKIKNDYEALAEGVYGSVQIQNNDIFCYVRKTAKQKILVALNFSENSEILKLEQWENGKLLCNTMLDRKNGEIISLKNCRMRPFEGIVLLV